MSIAKDDPIVIVGSGIFGVSTALYLAQRGYTKVTVLDKHDYVKSQFSYFKGADAASADNLKMVRSAYGSQTEYQNLSVEAIKAWHGWNQEIASGANLPQGMTAADRVFVANGCISITSQSSLPIWEQQSLASLQLNGATDVLSTTDSIHQKIAKERNLLKAMDPFQREARGKSSVGILDVTGGMSIADKSCLFAIHKAKSHGVEFIFGPEAGAFKELAYSPNRDKKTISGIVTKDHSLHPAKLCIMACGAATPTLLPQLDGLCEATCGNCVFFKIPRTSLLWDQFSSEEFPNWTWDMRGGADGGLYGFPRDDEGWMKIGYRGTTYTNPVVQGDGVLRSTPKTAWSPAMRDGVTLVGEVFTSFPEQALHVIKGFVEEYLPELAEENIGIASTRACWYTDSPDKHFLIDYVPGTEGLMVATGGSGHAFKYLPIIGNWVVDIMEQVELERPAIQAWRWLKTRVAPSHVNAASTRLDKAALLDVDEVRQRTCHGGSDQAPCQLGS